MWPRIALIVLGAHALLAQNSDEDYDDTLPTSDTGCVCVSYRLCDAVTGEVVIDGSSILERRVGPLRYEACACPDSENPAGEQCDNPNDVCCHLPGTSTTITVPDNTLTTITVPDNTLTTITLPDNTSTTITLPPPQTEEPEGSWRVCGKKGLDPASTRNDLIGTRVITPEGVEGATFPDEFPWMAVLVDTTLNTATNPNQIACGASIIHPQVVLTAAHCVYGLQEPQLIVRAGMWELSDMEDTQSSPVERIIRHPDYVHRNFRNDLALLILQERFRKTHNVGSICLPPPDSTYDKMTCTATGWGTTTYGPPALSDTLKQVDLKVVPHRRCQSQLRKSDKIGPWFKLHESLVCAKGEENGDTCQGDGGGPLVCKKPGSDIYVQVGIVAAGIECANEFPALYTNVPLLMPWIQDKLKEWNFELQE